METTRPSLLARVRNRQDSAAWQEFFALYSGLIEGYARSRGLGAADAADIAGECLQVLATKMPDFEYDRQKGRFRNWLRRMVNNKIIDHYRKRRSPSAPSGVLETLTDGQPDPSELWEKSWQQAHLAHCLKQLRDQVPHDQYEAFRLYAIEELPVEQVAEQLCVTVNQVYVAKSRLTARLRQAMERLLGDQD